MSVVLRLQRVGKKAQPHYRIVAIDKKKAVGGPALEIVGHYHPTMKKDQLTIDLNKVSHWLSKGAKPSDTVSALIKKAKKK